MLPNKPINWTNTLFLGGTLLLTLTAVPAYLVYFGCPLWLFALFMFFVISTAMSITLGYHRLFSHFTFHASSLVKLYTLLFGAAAFEGSALAWSADHRRHHKFVDQEEDPYDINKGFFHAHIGWLLFRHGLDTPLTWVRDLQKDRLAMYQHNHYVPIAIFMSFVLPTAIGWGIGGGVGALGAFLIAGVARIVVVHHTTFCINSLCHWIGDRPYSGTCSARDSILMALVTFGEGYHNYHHTFQHDYRNGIAAYHWDPTKWMIWVLNKLGLVHGLRTVEEERILKAVIAEQERRVSEQIAKESALVVSDSLKSRLQQAREVLEQTVKEWEPFVAEYREALKNRSELSLRQFQEMKTNYEAASLDMHQAIARWKKENQLVLAQATYRN